MGQRSAILQKIHKWIDKKMDIQAAIMVGSEARTDHPADQYSDFDIEIYSDRYQTYATDETWIKEIDNIWVCVREKNNEGYPARLVIFNEGVKVDFSFFPLTVINKLLSQKQLPQMYNKGYRFLVDRGKYKLPMQKLKVIMAFENVSEKEFVRIVEEFWFEAWHVAKYLKRDDLWTAKFRDDGMKKFLLSMIEWHAKSMNEGNYETWHEGRFMKEWVNPTVWNELQQTFGYFDAKDSWRALFISMDLFRMLAKETASKLGYTYPIKVDINISHWIKETRPALK